jgi:hypothetical protein
LPNEGKAGHGFGEPLGDGASGGGAREQGDQGDQDLDGGQEAVGRVGQIQGVLGAVVAFVGPLLEPGLAGRNHGDLGHGEQAIAEDQEGDQEKIEADFIHIDGIFGWKEARTLWAHGAHNARDA